MLINVGMLYACVHVCSRAGEELSVDTSVEMVVGDTVEVEPEAVVTASEYL